MSSRHQPLNGADSAQALANAIALVEAAGIHVGPALPACRACSERALPDDLYCAGHARLMEYTDHERSGGIAANE